MALSIESTRSIPRSADAVGLAVASSGTIPRQLGLNRSALSAQGFEGKIGQTL
ncbi:MAG: cytosol aminopeptidase, partial [Actinomycetota bacterium]